MGDDAGTWTFVCRLSDLQVGGARGVEGEDKGQDQAFVVRADGGLYAYVNSCPHWPMSPLPWRKDEYLDAARRFIVCHGHGARFNIGDGLCVAGPCVGMRLTALPLRLEEDRICVLLQRALLERPSS